MLLVPPGAAYQKPHNIVLAFDLSNSVDVVALSNAKQFAQLLDVTLDIICMEDEPDKQLQKEQTKFVTSWMTSSRRSVSCQTMTYL